MKKLIFLGWALIALLASGCSDDNGVAAEEPDVDAATPVLHLTEAEEAISHYSFDEYPSYLYENFYLAFQGCQEYCVYVAEDYNAKYTAEEIFELADEIKPASEMCECGISQTLSIPKAEKNQRVWVAVRNHDLYAVESAWIGRVDKALGVDISGVSVPDPMDVVFKVLVKNAAKAKYVVYDTASHTKEEAIEQLNEISTLPESGTFWSYGYFMAAGNMSKEAYSHTHDISVSDVFMPNLITDIVQNAHTYTIIVWAQDENGEEIWASQTVKALGQPYIILGKGREVVYVDMDDSTEDSTTKYIDTTEEISIAYRNGQKVCWIVTDDLEKEFTAQEIFELSDNVSDAKYMRCLVCDSDYVSIPKTDKPQRFWFAVSNEIYFAVESRLVGALETEEDETTNTESGLFDVCSGEDYEEEEVVVVDMGGNDDK